MFCKRVFVGSVSFPHLGKNTSQGFLSSTDSKPAPALKEARMRKYNHEKREQRYQVKAMIAGKISEKNS